MAAGAWPTLKVTLHAAARAGPSVARALPARCAHAPRLPVWLQRPPPGRQRRQPWLKPAKPSPCLLPTRRCCPGTGARTHTAWRLAARGSAPPEPAAQPPRALGSSRTSARFFNELMLPPLRTAPGREAHVARMEFRCSWFSRHARSLAARQALPGTVVVGLSIPHCAQPHQRR